MSVNWAQLYADLSAQLQAHVDLPFYQDFFVNFYRAFIDGARWKLYLSGLRMTIEVTVLALIMGIILGEFMRPITGGKVRNPSNAIKNWIIGWFVPSSGIGCANG